MVALVQSEVATPHAEGAFVLEFMHEEADLDLSGKAGYSLATFQAAVEGVTAGLLVPVDGGLLARLGQCVVGGK